MNQSKLIVFILEIDLASLRFSRSSSQVSDDTMSTETYQEGGSAQDPSRKIITPWTFNVKFPLGTQFTFGSLTIATGEDGELRMLPLVPAPERLAPADGHAPWSLTTSYISSGAFSGLDPFAGLYIHTGKIVRGIPVVTSTTLQPLTRASSSSSSAASPNQDSSDDYPEIGISAYGDSAGEDRLIFMAVLNGDPSHNSFSRYPTIGRSEASDARTPNDRMIRNLNLDFNAIQLRTIMESIQRMAPKGSPLIALAQQGVEVVNVIVAQRSADNPRGESSVDN
jgi:hypothetical protein